MDRGIWAVWYDLPESGGEEYVSWLHEKHLPEMLKRPGFLWAAHFEVTGGGAQMNRVQEELTYTPDESIGSGTDYVLLFGAASPHVFCDPSLTEIEAAQSAETSEMLSRRVGVRTCIFSEEARVDGPEVAARGPGLTPGPTIQMGSFNANSLEAEFDLGAWYAQYRLPTMGRMKGCLGARKLVSVSGWAKHSILYEFTSLEAREENFMGHEAKALDEKEWSGRIIRSLTHAAGSPSVGIRIWPQVE